MSQGSKMMQQAKSMMGLGEGSKYAPVKAKSLEGGDDGKEGNEIYDMMTDF